MLLCRVLHGILSMGRKWDDIGKRCDKMQIFERSRAELVKGVFYSLGGGLVGFVVAGVAGWPPVVLVLLPVACTLAVAWLLVFGEHIRVEVHDGGRMDFYRMGRLKKTLDLNNCSIRVSAGPGGKISPLSMRDFTVRFADRETGKSTKLDFAPLGREGFGQLQECLRAYSE